MARILFLEDEKVIREVLTEYMTVAGHQVDEAATGDIAMEKLDESLGGNNPYEMAILDIKVPGATGIEVLSYIRKIENRPIGVIMLTAYDDDATQVEAFNYFADDYITKPASPIILLKRIEAVLRRMKPSDSNSKQEEGYFVDEGGYRLLYGDKDLGLTVSEFLLMKILKNSPGQVFNREQLILGVFNEDYIGNDRIIDAHIKNLRKKMPVNVIETVIGIGYKWRIEG